MATKYFVLFTVLKSAGKAGVAPEECAKELNFAVGSVAPYMNSLRTKFGAEIETVKDGRTIKAYVLKNVSVVENNITPNRRGKVTAVAPVAKKARVVKVKPVAKVKAKKVVIKVVETKLESKKREKVEAPDADLHITEFSDGDLADIKAQLGL